MTGRPNRRGWGWIRKLPSKRWHASYIGPDRVRHNAPVTYGAKMDAERWLSDERRLIERDEWTPPAQRSATKKARGVSVAEYATTWLAQRPLKHRTRAHYAALLANHIASSTLGGIAAQEPQPAGGAGLVLVPGPQPPDSPQPRLFAVARHLRHRCG